MTKIETVRPSVHNLYKNTTQKVQPLQQPIATKKLKQPTLVSKKKKGAIRKGRAFLALILMTGGTLTILLSIVSAMPSIYKMLNTKLLQPIEPYLQLFGIWSPLFYSVTIVLFFIWIYCTYQAIRLIRKEARENH